VLFVAIGRHHKARLYHDVVRMAPDVGDGGLASLAIRRSCAVYPGRIGP